MSLRDEILARADCADMVTARDCNGIAALVSVGRKAVQPRYVTARTVLAEISGGAALLDKMQSIGTTQAAVKYAMTFLNQEAGIDIGNYATQAMIDQLVAGAALTAAEGTSLKNMALLAAPVSPRDVAVALFNDDGSPK